MMSFPPTLVRPAPLRRRGFTTLELMVAMAIIVVLLGIVVFGYRRVATGAQEKQTRTILERLRTMTTSITGNKLAGQKFFQQQIPYVYAQPVSDANAANLWEAVRAGADDSIYRTALILRAIEANPEARAIYDELPTERKRTMFFDQGNFGKIVAASGANILSVSMPLDAWGNPIRFVFDNWQVSANITTANIRTLESGSAIGGATGGLTDLYSTSAKLYWEPSEVAPPIVLLPNGYVRPTPTPPYQANPDRAIRSPDRQPFWASAGPDGLLVTQDDNVLLVRQLTLGRAKR